MPADSERDLNGSQIWPLAEKSLESNVIVISYFGESLGLLCFQNYLVVEFSATGAPSEVNLITKYWFSRRLWSTRDVASH